MLSVKALSQARIVFASLVAFLCVSTTPLRAADEQWSREFFSPAAGSVTAIALAPDGRLICGGTSLLSDDGNAQVVAFSNSRRTRLAAPNGLAAIYAIAIDGTNIYVGGDFKGLSGCAVTNIAKWDGVAGWLSVGKKKSGVRL